MLIASEKLKSFKAVWPLQLMWGAAVLARGLDVVSLEFTGEGLGAREYCREGAQTSLEYSEKALYNQICFYRFIFDWEHAVAKVLPPDERKKFSKTSSEKEAYRRLKEVPDKALATSSYSDVNLAKLFQAFASVK
uniref:Polymerase (DNA directed), alpha 1 n=1 Tax=Iconisemion striatum TaxID=60296 RepID=A0A1A7WCE0_9TELE